MKKIISGEDLLTIERVPYAKARTPKALREYKIVGSVGCPVGTFADWNTESDGKITLLYHKTQDGVIDEEEAVVDD